MFTNIDDAISWIIEQRNDESTFEHFKYVCEKLNNPQNNFYMIHVAGTDGKGSTVTFLRDLLMKQGLKVGTLQSPHYLIHQDRIRVNGQNITDEAFLRIMNDYYDFFIENKLSMFEMDYLIMCEYFKQCQIDIAIVEVGLGGRLDSTNVVDNTKLSIITTIGFDHMDRLGDTLQKICFEKCGIIKDNSKVLIGKLNDECIEVVENVCNDKNAKLYSLGQYTDLGERKFAYQGKEYTLTSYAKYQMHNASLAIKALEIIKDDYPIVVDENKVYEAISNTIWPCRFELVKEKPRVILDGAHNIHGVEALCESVDNLKGSKCIIFSALKRKEYQKMIEMLAAHCDELVLTTFNFYGVIDLKDYKDSGYSINDDFIDAIDKAIVKYDNVIICGSLYFMSDVVANYKFC
ncbi:MAG: folylpolyglutamate synthase/dihydrofolate synthase family protein [Erysipelotrichaceae bacterium]|nr:folylpolyglutamate synthase/dihydrofolate synthase family protein [Erysipelotrichaceae bacterium]